MRLKVLPLTVLTIAALPSQAADAIAQWYANPQIGYVWADTGRDYENNACYGLAIGRSVTAALAVELAGVSSPEAHLRWDFFGDSLRRGHLDYTAGIGLQLPFGSSAARP